MEDEKGERIRALVPSEANAIWTLIKKECGKNVNFEGVSPYFIKFSIEYISSVLNREFTLDIEDYLKRGKGTMADFLEWKESALYANVKVYGERLVDEWAASKYPQTVKMLIEKIENDGSMKSAEILFKSIGKSEGTKVSQALPKVEWVKNYKIEPGGKVTAQTTEVKVSGEGKVVPAFDVKEITEAIKHDEHVADERRIAQAKGVKNRMMKSQKINQVVEDLKNKGVENG